MKRVHWLYASAASVLLHGAAVWALKSNVFDGGGPPPGQAVAETGALAGIIGSAIEIDQSEAPREPEDSEQADLPEPVDVEEPAAADTATETQPNQLEEVPAETRVAMAAPLETVTDVPVLPQLAASQAAEDQFAMAAPVAEPADTAEVPLVRPKEVETDEVGNTPPPAASPRREEKRRISRERQKAEELKKRKANEADGREKTTSQAQRRGNSANQGNAGSSRGGGGKAGASPGALNSYAAIVRSRVFSRRPSSSIGGGKAVVSFGLSASGGLRYARISKSSGNASIDRMALASVRSAAPFPTPPAGARSNQLRFSIFFQF